jgi:endonuclease YncB( thermonuclease family)
MPRKLKLKPKRTRRDHYRRSLNRALWAADRLLERFFDELAAIYYVSVKYLREAVRELAALPFMIKIAVVIGIAGIFVVITQWERIGSFIQSARLQPPAPIAAQASASRPPTIGRPADIAASPAEEPVDETSDEYRARRLGRLIINGAKVNADGSITDKDRTLYLYGIKPFNSKNICKRASGEPWACGLQAYAGLRNAVANKIIVCQPKKILTNGLSVTCRIGDTDIAVMLVNNGLVALDDNVTDAALTNAQSFAKVRKIGIWDR